MYDLIQLDTTLWYKGKKRLTIPVSCQNLEWTQDESLLDQSGFTEVALFLEPIAGLYVGKPAKYLGFWN